MAIFHCSIKIISRASGRSAVASAAYRSGEKLYNAETGLTHDFTKKGGVVFSEICIPDNVSQEFQDREYFWTAVQNVEKRADAQLAREIEVGIPIEFSREQQIKCVQSYIQENFVSKGMCADWSLHDKKDGNPHAHILLTVRAFDKNGTWIAKQKTSFAYDEEGKKIPLVDEETGKQKIRIRDGKGTEKLWVRTSIPSNDWNDHSKAEEWREAWADECNKYLAVHLQIDHRSYKRQGIQKVATIHEGIVARDIEKKGGVSTKCELNREIRKYNTAYEQIKEKALDITKTVISKARAIIDGFNEFRRGHKNIGIPRRNASDIGKSTDRNRAVTTGEYTITRSAGRISSIRTDIKRRVSDTTVTEQEIKGTESDIENTDRFIEKLSRLIEEKEHEKNERIRKLLKRRKNAKYGGTTNRECEAGRNDSAALIREIRATTDNARATVNASTDTRESRELEQQRFAATRSRADVSSCNENRDGDRRERERNKSR
ncbi:MAG: MobQ family relaxase [Suipraeoptans sp.]